ncbi:conjugal transfer protein TrbF [Komagataeibacter rhaeticus]|uniref:conjugal transfer protein TrbF n=1 Tax=Komagataeibacter rhaeticus TaxID=215221 RepID=UPI000D9D7182|nr:conjugal transfer protein TrbF [Komagataeibacter rhaeticus]PYD52815.1 conjugal transfer protein TrbF [Komagataeibacter rhaeticus]GBQ11881.1 conjugal transfer protein TrbF [Komagataeibacter rhaeticus DSM 16663]
MFRRSTSRYGTTPEPVTPYQKAAQAWDERIGSARVQACNWRLMAFGSLFLSAGLGVGLVWQSMRGTVVPWVVQVDRLGQAQVVVPATASYTPTDPQIAWYLAQFMQDVRSLSSDAVVVRHNWLRAYDYTTTSGGVSLNDYARLNDPFSRIGREQVEVDVSSVIRASPGSFRVAWTEHHYRDGAFTGTERWTAIVSVVLRTPRDADHLRKNPLGIYVSGINWSKELGQ